MMLIQSPHDALIIIACSGKIQIQNDVDAVLFLFTWSPIAKVYFDYAIDSRYIAIEYNAILYTLRKKES